MYVIAIAYYWLYGEEFNNLLLHNKANDWRAKITRDILQGYIIETEAVDVTDAVPIDTSSHGETEASYIREKYQKYKLLSSDAYGTAQPTAKAVRDSSTELFLGYVYVKSFNIYHFV